MIRLLSAYLFFLFLAFPAQAADAIKVGFSISLTGQYAEPALRQYRGLEMWAADLNARGALLGRPVELVYYDDASSPEKSADIYSRLINQDRVDLLIGPYSSDLTLAASTVAEEHKFPMVAAGAAAEEIWKRGYTNIFGVDSPASAYMNRVMAFAESKGLDRIALVYEDTSFTREVAEGVRLEAQKRGMRIAFDESLSDTTDFLALTRRMSRSNPEILIGSVYEAPAISLMRQARAQELAPKIVAFTVAPALFEFGKELGRAVEGVMGPVVWMRSDRMPMAQDFSFRYKQRYGSNAGYHAAYGYAAGQVVEAAVRLADTLEKNEIRDTLATMTFISLLGRYRVDETGKQIGDDPLVLQWQDGSRRLVLPKRLAEREVRYPAAQWPSRSQ